MGRIVRLKNTNLGKVFIWLLFLGYSAILFYGILAKGAPINEVARDALERIADENLEISSRRVNLVPFETIKLFINYRSSVSVMSFITNLFGNIVAFIPVGILLMLLEEKKRKLIKITIIGGLYSILLELIQLFTGIGVFDIDDILLNTLGAFIGASFVAFYYYLYARNNREE